MPAEAADRYEPLMRLAIEKARVGLAAGQAPFGCAIELDAQVVAVEHNTTAATIDCTAHAEVNALRAACRAVGKTNLAGAIVVTTCEPCPMCTGALHWAGVAEVHFGASIDDAERAELWQLKVRAADLLARGGSNVRVSGGLLVDECLELFRAWQAMTR
jgi:tRNA(Arg) A34 adenosine deaminase TadA